MDQHYAFLRTRNREGATAAAHRAALAIPPLWPLPSSVAVNPFLGQSAEDLAHAGARLARVAGAPVAMPRTWYRDLIADGTVTDADLYASLSAAPSDGYPLTLATLKAAVHATVSPVQALPTVADLAADIAGVDWPGLIANRLGAWAADYFDCGQALWAAPHGPNAYAAWRSVACHDLTPEIIGLTGFAAFVAETPERARDAVTRATERLGLPTEALDSYFHRLLMSLGGWAQFARTKLWQAERGSGTDSTLTDLLAIRLIWEEVLFDRYATPISDRWEAVRTAHASPITPSLDQQIDALLQEATERAAQRRLGAILAAPRPVALDAPDAMGATERPALQAVFCIDVRSEVFRRALEAANPAIRTHGMAGFFGMATEHRRFASDVVERRLPVLLAPGMRTCAGGPADTAADQAARFKARAKRAWVRFKFAAVSSFAFVEASGPLYVAKLLRDALGSVAPFAPPDPPMDPPPRLEPGFLPTVDGAARVAMAAGALRSMGLTSGFARLVLLSAHGAAIVNNPHAAGLQCGACGGSSGEVNARLLAALVNDPTVRTELLAHQIDIPADTLFVAALHDTTSDEVTLYADDHPSADHRADLDRARRWLAAAGVAARAERAARLPRAVRAASLRRRGGDWAEVRPEWGLAGCMAFIAAPRARTVGKSLHGRAFLHDYDWRQDADGTVLEMILTAPVVVAGWISLQYYGSTVAPQVFGSGNKILHNVTGGIGVVEGNGGVLRGGLPWQSVHDGLRFVHEPLRLSVCVEAPSAAITDILQRHADLRMLFDNRWLHLIVLDAEGRMSWRYAGDLRWLPMAEKA